MSGYEYCRELDEFSPRADQPAKISVNLKNHQLAAVKKAIEMETMGCVKFNTRDNVSYIHGNIVGHNEVDVRTNVGIFGDVVGYGKTLTALSLVASSSTENIHINEHINISYCNPKNYSYISYATNNNKLLNTPNIIDSTLIVVPRGPVYVQWEKALRNNTTLKYIAIDNLTYIKNHLPSGDCDTRELIDFFNQYDVVLIKNTTLDILFSTYHHKQDTSNMSHISIIKRWKRIMIDEAHDICNSVSQLYYEFLWLITATYDELPYSIRSYKNILFNMRDAFNNDTINMVLVKGKTAFVRNSFRIPPPKEIYYLCKMKTQMSTIKNFICASVLEKLNANDIKGAIQDLGGKTDTETNIIDLVSKEICREITNKELEKEYISNLDIPIENKTTRIDKIESEIATKKLKLDNLKERICEMNNKMCPICMYDIENPVLLQCTHSYCMSCIVKWLGSNMNCPECRQVVDTQKIISVVKEEDKRTKNAQKQKILNKTETLVQIIKKNLAGKYLIFSKNDNNLNELQSVLRDNDITSSEMKGNTACMMKTLKRFNEGCLNVILLNTNFAGSGIDIQTATDVIIYHSMGVEKFQAIGRAQRVGRTEELNIHYLCYDHEMPADKK
jgi:SNF2 family DNA or RNA helicase